MGGVSPGATLAVPPPCDSLLHSAILLQPLPAIATPMLAALPLHQTRICLPPCIRHTLSAMYLPLPSSLATSALLTTCHGLNLFSCTCLSPLATPCTLAFMHLQHCTSYAPISSRCAVWRTLGA